jgi:predicted RNA-binding protein with PUA domain
MDEKAERGNVYRTHCEDEQRLITNRGKVYMLTIGQCTQALKDKLKEDSTWDTISALYDSIGLLALIEKYVLKQTESHYPYLAVQEELRSMLNFAQGKDMTLGMYYEKISTRVAIAERAGCSFVTPSLLNSETETQFPGQDYHALGDPDRLKVKKAAKDKYLEVLFLMRSGKRHLQLQNDIKNDHAKGVENAFPPTIASAMQILNDYKPVVTEAPKQAALGTAFAQDGSKKKTKGRLMDQQWNALSPEAKSALIQKRKDKKAAKPAAASGNEKKSSSKKDDDDSLVSSTKRMADLQKENARLKRSNKKVRAALITTIDEGAKNSSLSEEGSQSFNAAMAVVQDNYAKLHDRIVLAHRSPELNLRNEILIDSQTTHDVFCNKHYVKNS